MPRRSLMPSLCGALLGFLLVAGCGSLQPGFTPDPWELDGDLLSTNALIVADNQEHHLFGDGVWIRSGLTDRLVRPAIRSTPLELFSSDVLGWVLDGSLRAGLVLHLGDALDISCLAEWEAFEATMAVWERPWFLAPGNHDGYYFGNGHFAEGEWRRACGRPGSSGPTEALNKERVVARYLEAVAAQDDPGAAAFRAESTRHDPAGEWRYAGAERAAFRRVAWRRDEARPWRSYVAQEIDLTSAHSDQKVVALLLDTSQYRRRPRLVPSPFWANSGVTGSIGRDQRTVVRRWADEARQEGAVIVLMAHHPFAKLKGSTRRALNGLIGDNGVRLLLSAHSHDGRFITHAASRGRPSFLELNVGSTVDWPIEVRTLRLTALAEGRSATQLRSQLYPLGELWEEAGGFDPRVPECEPEWRQGPEFYIAHVRQIDPSPGKTHGRLMDAVLETFDLALSEAPTDPDEPAPWPPGTSSDAEVKERIEQLRRAGALREKVDFGFALARFDRGRTALDPVRHRTWRLCQALWASLDDEKEARLPRRRDTFVSFDEE